MSMYTGTVENIYLSVNIFLSRCEFTIDLRIKPASKSILKVDKYRAQYPCFIVIKGTHNHSLESAAGLRQLRVLPETREELFKYYDMGEYDMATCYKISKHLAGGNIGASFFFSYSLD